jgi:flagellar M-ring protein FliF
MMGVKNFAAQPAVAKSLPMLGLLAMLGIAALLWMSFSTPTQKPLFAGLADEDKAAVAEALQTAGLEYSLDQNTGALSVAQDDYYQARMLLAQQGLPKSAPDGSAMIDKLQLGASRAVETERLRSAREVDLARTIEAIDSVKTAKVHLAVETPSVFLRDRSKPAASVMLTLASGRSLGDAQVQAIVHLVASSVSGLDPDGVSVVDQNGRLLSREGDGGVAETSERQVAVQTMIEDRYRQSLAQLLTPILGEGNFTTEVHADVDFAEVQSTREGYPKDAATLRSEEGSFSAEGAGGGEAGGIPGALSNQAPPASQVAAAPGGALPADPTQQFAGAAANGVKNQNYTRDFAVGREVSVTKQQVGQVKRLSVAVALKNPEKGKPRSQAEIMALETLVKGAIGFDQARGDVVALSARKFAPPADDEAAASSWMPTWLESDWASLLVRNLTALIAVLVFIFAIGKPMLKKGSAALADHSKKTHEAKQAMGSDIAAALADQAVVDPNTKVTLGMIESARSYEARASLIRGFVRQDPARAALVVRDLIRQDSKEGAELNG